jgi:hypothetical protein
MRKGWGILGIIALALCSATTGCSTACPAIGYISTVEVHLEGNAGAVNEVQLCNEQGCSQPEPTAGQPVPRRTITTESLDPRASPAPAVDSPPPNLMYGRRAETARWVFTFPFGAPQHVTVRALTTDGGVLAQQDNELIWTRVGGTPPCPGPVTTPPIKLLMDGS